VSAKTKVYRRRRHNCDAKHRMYRTLAKCMFQPERPAWVVGDGEYATLARCGVLTVALHETIEQAQHAMRWIDSHGCGGQCHRDHELVRLGL
jgi:hypothetical protein